MKKIIYFFLVCVLCMAMTAPAYATDYIFSSGSESLSVFGKPTSNDTPVSPDSMSENIRRNKDAAHMPPPYFYGSGDIPTEQSSFYHDNIRGNSHATFSSSNTGIANSITLNTEPLYYADGSIGTLYVEKTKKTIKVYEGESQDNLKKGAGRFSMTSAWTGNIGICGHNRGSSAFFNFVKDLKTGDRITYTTLYGSRTYEVFSLEQIGEYDYSKLGWSVDNILTLITCVANSPEARWVAQLREVI